MATAAVTNCSKGPRTPRSGGLTTALPPGASVRGIRVTNGIASVSLDAEILKLGQSIPGESSRHSRS